MNNVMQQLQKELTQLEKDTVDLKPTSCTTPLGELGKTIKHSDLQ